MSLLMRRNLMGGSKMLTAKDYVQDGLLYLYDGIENDGYGIHNPNVSWMTDLVSGAKSNYLANDRQVVRDDCIELLGVDTVANLMQHESVMSVEIVCSNLSGSRYATAPLFYTSTGRNRVISVGIGNKIGFCGNINRCVQIIGTASVSANYTTRNGNDGSFVAKINNEEVSSYLSGVSTWQASLQNRFGGLGGFYSKGKIYCIRAYDHNLDSAEIAANYSVDKARFGLT